MPKEVQEEMNRGDAELMTLTWLRNIVSLKVVMVRIWITVAPKMEAWLMDSTPMTMTTEWITSSPPTTTAPDSKISQRLGWTTATMLQDCTQEKIWSLLKWKTRLLKAIGLQQIQLVLSYRANRWCLGQTKSLFHRQRRAYLSSGHLATSRKLLVAMVKWLTYQVRSNQTMGRSRVLFSHLATLMALPVVKMFSKLPIRLNMAKNNSSKLSTFSRRTKLKWLRIRINRIKFSSQRPKKKSCNFWSRPSSKTSQPRFFTNWLIVWRSEGPSCTLKKRLWTGAAVDSSA